LIQLLPFAFLWLILINQLRIEWTVNPQYNYGWAVPFLCAFLGYRRWKMGDGTRVLEDGRRKMEDESLTGVGSAPISHLPSPISRLPSLLFYLLLALLALLYAPTRLIQEANPEWRLVSWALALEVIGLTLVFLRIGGGDQSLVGQRVPPAVVVRGVGVPPAYLSPAAESKPAKEFHLPSSIFHFPLLFFLVAVPWPTFLEHPTVELLTRANVGVVIELLNGLGIPAIQQGNVIEISNGLVGIDEACSGIRSVQASLMISLFLGEFYRLTVLRRGVLCFGGLLAAFVFNVVRTFFLTWVASKQGLAVMAQWHDPAGVGVLVACFLGVWGLATLLAQREDGRWKMGDGRQEMEDGSKAAAQRASPATNRGAGVPPAVHSGVGVSPANLSVADEAERSEVSARFPSDAPAAASDETPAPRGFAGGTPAPRGFGGETAAPVSRLPSSIYLPSALLLWLLAVESGVEVWYRIHEARLPKSVQWNAHAPAGAEGSKELPLAEAVRQLLRYDEAQNTIWREADGTHWQMIYLRWRPGRVAVHLAKSHTPEVCLTAAGRKLEAMSDLKWFSVQGLRLPFRSYMYREGNRPVYVFYCLWEDRAEEQGFRGEELTYDNRFSPVWAGRRNLGQRVLEMAVWGMEDLAQAEAGLKKQLEAVIQKQSRK